MKPELASSYQWCTKIARTRAANFYYSFLLLDKPRRNAMCAVYAFMRICDDLSDEPGQKSAAAFEEWRRDMDEALQGRFSDHPLWPAFHDTATFYRIPHEYFHHMIDGVASDIDFRGIDTFEQLYQYCYRVASVVGLTVIHILGFHTPDALPLAEKCGVAFQLTNILRDVREDRNNGRIYLPAEDMERFGVSERDLGEDVVSPALRTLLEFEAARAESFYQSAMPLIGMVSHEGQPMLSAIIEIYHSLLHRMEAQRYEVLRERISLSKARKLWILARTKIRPRLRPLDHLAKM